MTNNPSTLDKYETVDLTASLDIQKTQQILRFDFGMSVSCMHGGPYHPTSPNYSIGFALHLIGLHKTPRPHEDTPDISNTFCCTRRSITRIPRPGFLLLILLRDLGRLLRRLRRRWFSSSPEGTVHLCHSLSRPHRHSVKWAPDLRPQLYH